MKAISPEDRKVVNVKDGTWERFADENGAEEGEVLHANPDAKRGYGFHAYRMAPGDVTVPHRHDGDEESLVIEGDLIDNDGFRYGPGDLVWLSSGTEHNSRSENGCLLAVYLAASTAVEG